MRWLLLIMTGIGFTLGLLCGLLLHLPADGLPANTELDDNNDVSSSHRSRRSFSSQDGGKLPSNLNEVGDDKLYADPASRLHIGEEGKAAFQSLPNPRIVANPFVSSGGSDGHNGGDQPAQVQSSVNGRGLDQAETLEKKGASQKDEAEKNSPPSASVPVTSFTLRLKRAGDKVVVDSAHSQQQQQHLLQDTVRSATHSKTSKLIDSSGTLSPNTLLFNGSKPTASDLVRGVLWAERLERSCPQESDAEEVLSWRRKAVGMQMVAVEDGCGRMQNRLVTFKDGSKACARYRLNTDQIQGEVYSYYLAQLLNMTRYMPPAIMVPVDTVSAQWRSVHLQLSMAQWADGRLVVLTRWLPDLAPSHIPTELREDDRKLYPVHSALWNKSHTELCDLLQWSDLIVFDYLTANLDRLVNNMFNRQWNAEMMNNPAHNLERTKSGSLVFLDNESGLFHGYRLLDKYRGYHDSLLQSLCVFRAGTARAVKQLHHSGDVGQQLQSLLTEGEVHHRHLPPMPDKNVRVLKDRLAKVYQQIVMCETVYGAEEVEPSLTAGDVNSARTADASNDQR